MSFIKELSPHVANLIAAGEVVERPASVAKELIENAIDAKASRIQVEIENGGISYMRIMDNGIGMSRQDAPIAFRRHATSKIKDENDLASIGTLGFRGEALAAIASVSRIDLFTKQDSDIAGFHIRLEAGQITESEDAGCPKGTTIIIRDLFFNTPARMKFLKKDYTEAGYVTSVVEHAALSHPEIAFSLIKDGKQIFSTSGDKKLMTPVFSVFGRELTSNMIEVKRFERENTSASGYITKPHFCRANRSMQYFFVNGRYVKSKIMQAALEEAYKNKIITGKYPSCALFLELPLNMVDVNVHPAKTEVKFAQEKTVFETVYIACKNALEQNDNIPVMQAKIKPEKQDNVTKEQIIIDVKRFTPEADKKKTSEPQTRQNITPERTKNEESNAKTTQVPSALFNLKKAKLPANFKPPVIECDDDFDSSDLKVSTFDSESADIKLEYEPVKREEYKQEQENIKSEKKTLKNESIENHACDETENKSKAQKSDFESTAKVIGEAFNTYIVAQDKDGFILLDKHAAHERMIFNELKSKADMSQQRLLTAFIAEMSISDFDIISKNIQTLEKLGFDISVFGEKSFAVRAVPAYIDAGDINSVLSEIAEKLSNYRSPVPDEYDDLIHTVSCKAAIKAGKATSMTEMQSLLDTVISDNEINCCPHGRPVMVRLTKYEIDKLFKRVNQ